MTLWTLVMTRDWIRAAESDSDRLSPTEEARAISIQLRGVVPTLQEWIASMRLVELTIRYSTSGCRRHLSFNHRWSVIINRYFWTRIKTIWRPRDCCSRAMGDIILDSASRVRSGLNRRPCTDWENTDDEYNRPQTVLDATVVQMVRH